MRDFKRLQEDPPAGVSGAPGENNIMVWNAVIFGPHDTPFEDGTFKLTMEFSEEYPNKPPVVKFLSKMFHPTSTRTAESASTFSRTGKVCRNWSICIVSHFLFERVCD